MAIQFTAPARMNSEVSRQPGDHCIAFNKVIDNAGDLPRSESYQTSHAERFIGVSMRRMLLSILITVIFFAALREVALRSLQPQELSWLYRILNAHQYRLYSPGSYKIFLDISESPMMYERAIGIYESTTFDSIQSRISSGMTFIDVGANKGDYTFFTGELVGDTGHVIAVEPVPENMYWLKKSLAENELENITLVEAALADENGYATFELGRMSGWGNLLSDDGDTGNKTIRVQKRTLDSLVNELELEQVDAIKIDVEGGEVSAVRGARQTIDRFKPLIWLDTHTDVDIDWLQEFFSSRDYRVIRLATAHELSEIEAPGRLLLLPDESG